MPQNITNYIHCQGSGELIGELLGMHEADMKPLASNEGKEVLPLVLQ